MQDPDHMDPVTAVLFYGDAFLFLFPILKCFDSVRAELSP
jgi:hypothetical protein